MAANEVGDIRAGEYLRHQVTDTGCGMTAEVMERAFEPFFTTKPVGKGTGLGLSQIFGFAHQSGGEVGIESEIGKGTTVSIYLPRTEAEAHRSGCIPTMQRARVEADVSPARASCWSRTIRASAPRRSVRSRILATSRRLRRRRRGDGLFDEQEFDLVISDVIMPEMTGPELVRDLKARTPDIAVLFVTGYVGEGESDDLVGYELLRKPFTVGALATAVAAALARPV